MSTATQTAPKAKIYHLLPSAKSTAEIYQRTSNKQRVRLESKPLERPYLQITFADVDGTNRTIRFKLNCNSIYQDEQLEKFKIPANEKFTKAERNLLYFRNGVLIVTNEVAQKFLDAHPQNSNFKGVCDEVKTKLFVEFDPVAKTKSDISEYRRRLEAATKITSLELHESQAMLVKLFGVSYATPNNLEDCTKVLIEFLEETDEDGVEAILREGETLQDEIVILVNKAVKADYISFNEVGMENFVVRKKSGAIMPVKEISAKISEGQRKVLFSEYLASPEGTLFLEDLRKEFPAETEQPEQSEKTEKPKAGKAKQPAVA